MAGGKSDGLLGGIIIGAAIGAIAGVLAAPRTGKDTRRILKKSADALPELAEDLATSLQFQADRLSENSLSNWEQTLSRLREAVVAGRAAGRQEWARQANIQTSDPVVGIADTQAGAHAEDRFGRDFTSNPSTNNPSAGAPIDEVANGLRSPRPSSSQSAAQSAALEE